ncbi:hypothetical protein C0993_007796 [Termitomyces sp. T159_Od127]|nr:hypothetical protein C0993_007796 [Termitomyces sp. T159_Od127]
MSDVQQTHDHLSTVSDASETPSFVDRMDLTSIASLATAIRNRTSSTSVACTVNPVPKSGSYNVVWFVDFEDNVHWVFRTPQTEWSPWLERRMRSDIVTMKLIQSRTTIPIPVIHDFSLDTNNVIGRPYIFFDRVEGTQICKLWFDPMWFTEERRKNVFRSLVSCMSQLRELKFSSIGCLEYDPKTDAHIVGPLLPTYAGISQGITFLEGPYYTSHDYLLSRISREFSEADSDLEKQCLALLRLFAGGLPDQSLDGPPFVLSMPDFNYQNIFVDNEGHVTGLIDWDNTRTFARQGGYARYPSWITRDWDPLWYAYHAQDEVPDGEDNEERHLQEDSDYLSDHVASGRSKDDHLDSSMEEDASLSKDVNGIAAQSDHLPRREQIHEDSPEVLQKFRDEYLCIFGEVDPDSANFTRDSHIYEAIDIGVPSQIGRDQILYRLAEYVFGRDPNYADLSAWSLLEGISVGQWLKPQVTKLT